MDTQTACGRRPRVGVGKQRRQKGGRCEVGEIGKMQLGRGHEVAGEWLVMAGELLYERRVSFPLLFLFPHSYGFYTAAAIKHEVCSLHAKLPLAPFRVE